MFETVLAKEEIDSTKHGLLHTRMANRVQLYMELTERDTGRNTAMWSPVLLQGKNS